MLLKCDDGTEREITLGEGSPPGDINVYVNGELICWFTPSRTFRVVADINHYKAVALTPAWPIKLPE